jgi:hypothetical protein
MDDTVTATRWPTGGCVLAAIENAAAFSAAAEAARMTVEGELGYFAVKK